MRQCAIGLILLIACMPPAWAADEVSYGSAPAWVKPVAIPKDDGAMPEVPARILLRN